MKCEMCLKDNAENRGIICGTYKVCQPCIDESIHARMWLLGRGKDVNIPHKKTLPEGN